MLTSIVAAGLVVGMAGCAGMGRSVPVYESPVVELRLGKAQVSDEKVTVTKAESISFLRNAGQTDDVIESELIAVSVLMGCDFDKDISLSYAYMSACETRLSDNFAAQYVKSYDEMIQPKITKKKGHASLPHKNFVDYVRLHNGLYYYVADVLSADAKKRSTYSPEWVSIVNEQGLSSQQLLHDFAAADSWTQFNLAREHIVQTLNSPSAVGKREALVLGIAMTSNLTVARDLLNDALASREHGLQYIDWLMRKFRRYQVTASVELLVARSGADPILPTSSQHPDWPIGLLMFELVVQEGAGSTLIPLGIRRIETAPSNLTHAKYIYHLESEAQNEIIPSNINGMLISNRLQLRYYQIGTLNKGHQTTPKYIEN
jgi:hypothetical protein